MGYKLGLDGFVHYDTSGVASPTWLDADNVEEVTLNLERPAGEIKNRSSDWMKVLLGKQGASIEITMTYNGGAADWEAFRDAYLNGTDIGVAIMTGDIATVGSEGLVADMKVTAMSRAEPLEEGMQVTFTLQPSAASATEPAWSETTV